MAAQLGDGEDDDFDIPLRIMSFCLHSALVPRRCSPAQTRTTMLKEHAPAGDRRCSPGGGGRGWRSPRSSDQEEEQTRSPKRAPRCRLGVPRHDGVYVRVASCLAGGKVGRHMGAPAWQHDTRKERAEARAQGQLAVRSTTRGLSGKA